MSIGAEAQRLGKKPAAPGRAFEHLPRPPRARGGNRAGKRRAFVPGDRRAGQGIQIWVPVPSYRAGGSNPGAKIEGGNPVQLMVSWRGTLASAASPLEAYVNCSAPRRCSPMGKLTGRVGPMLSSKGKTNQPGAKSSDQCSR